MNELAKFLFHIGVSALGRKSYRFPFGIYIYLTFRCNLRCSYCDGGSGEKFPHISQREITPAEWKRIIALMASHSNVLMLSGGEPLVYEGFGEIVRSARESGFTFLSLNTNGILLTPEIAGMVDAIIVSLDSLDRSRSDAIWNRAGATEQVIRTLDRLSAGSHPSLMVNCVILPENLADVEEVLKFCIPRGITFSAGPALIKTAPVPGLVGNPDYERLIDALLRHKRAGRKIAGTVEYFKSVKRFRPFDCQPQLVWRVFPAGDLVFPCSRLNRTIGNLLEMPDPIGLFRKAAGGEFYRTDCGWNCPLSCYMDPSITLHRPLGMIREGLFRMRAFSRGHRLLF